VLGLVPKPGMAGRSAALEDRLIIDPLIKLRRKSGSRGPCY
jgi:hypothetical protein